MEREEEQHADENSEVDPLFPIVECEEFRKRRREKRETGHGDNEYKVQPVPEAYPTITLFKARLESDDRQEHVGK